MSVNLRSRLEPFKIKKSRLEEDMALAAEELKQQLFKKITNLSDSRLQEVLDFVEFLSIRGHQVEDSEDPLLRILGGLSGTPISAEEIEQELYGKGFG